MTLPRDGGADEAEALYGRSLELKRGAGDAFGTAHTLLRVAALHRARGDHAAAREIVGQALRLREAVAERQEWALLREEDALCLAGEGDPAGAGAMLRQAAEVLDESGSLFHAARVWWHLAETQRARGVDPSEALRRSLHLSALGDYQALRITLAESSPALAKLAGVAPSNQPASAPSHQADTAVPLPLQITLFGDFTVRLGGLCIPVTAWRRHAARLVLAYLALAGPGGASRDRILTDLFPDADPAVAAGVFYVNVRALREALEPNLPRGAASTYVINHGGVYTLAPHVLAACDARDFDTTLACARTDPGSRGTHLAQAFALYHGDLLPDPRFANCEWLFLARERYRERAERAGAELAAWHTQAGDGAGAMRAWERVLDLHPAHERAHHALMRLYADAGQRDRAVEQYGRCVDALRRLLDIAPTPRTDRLYARIKAGTSLNDT